MFMVAILHLSADPFTQPNNDAHYTELIYTHTSQWQVKEGSKISAMCMQCIIHSKMYFVVPYFPVDNARVIYQKVQ
jgi:hypothetical protein